MMMMTTPKQLNVPSTALIITICCFYVTASSAFVAHQALAFVRHLKDDVGASTAGKLPPPIALSTRRMPRALFAHPTTSSVTADEQQSKQQRRQCFYRAPSNNFWKPRLELSELAVGQPLEAVVVQELLEGRTGPKVFCEVGVGRCRNGEKKDWKIVNAMLRLGRRSHKPSVAAKRAARLRRKKEGFPVYVSKIRLDNDQLEVCMDEDEAIMSASPLVSVSSLNEGQEVTGKVVRVEPYGVLVDVGANRHGLLHIQKVADLMQHYIDKEKGLNEAGLNRGAQIRLQVQSIHKKRLFLDFTEDAKQTALEANQAKELLEKGQTQAGKAPTETSTGTTTTVITSTSSSSSFALSPEEEAAWAAYASMDSTSQEDEVEEEDDDIDGDYDDDDDYDEDRAIEDAFGLGSY